MTSERLVGTKLCKDLESQSGFLLTSVHHGDTWTLPGQEAAHITVAGVWESPSISKVASGWHQTSLQKENEVLLESWEVLCAGGVHKSQGWL